MKKDHCKWTCFTCKKKLPDQDLQAPDCCLEFQHYDLKLLRSCSYNRTSFLIILSPNIVVQMFAASTLQVASLLALKFFKCDQMDKSKEIMVVENCRSLLDKHSKMTKTLEQMYLFM